jgi:hypothetical protein
MTRDLLVVQLPLLEKVLRTIAVYLFLVLTLRLAGNASSPSSTASTWWCCCCCPTPSRTPSSAPTAR